MQVGKQSHGALVLRLSSGWTRIKLIELEMRSAGSHLGREVSLADHTHLDNKLRLILKTALTGQQFLTEASWCVYGGWNRDESKVQENIDNATPHMDTTKGVKAAR